jgi:uncharacterized membrane protein YfcA
MHIPDNLPGYALLAAVTFLAGAINSVAGGGTILTFPVLTTILPETPARMVIANVTSTLGLVPGAIMSSWAYRRDREDLPRWATWLVIPCVAGAIAGAWLLIVLPPEWFERLVPWLILSAAVLFAVQPQLSSLTAARAASRQAAEPSLAACEPQSTNVLAASVAQFFVSLYGGYFGAGMGIVMLAMLGALGLGDIHKLNAVKNLLAMLVNGMAAVMLAVLALAGAGSVSWSHVAVMAVAASAGGLSGSLVARRLPQRAVRRLVAAIGFGLAGYYFTRS